MLFGIARELENPEELRDFSARLAQKWATAARTRLSRPRTSVDTPSTDGNTVTWKLPGQTATVTPGMWFHVEGRAILDPAKHSSPALLTNRTQHHLPEEGTVPEKLARSLAALCQQSGIPVNEETMSNIFALPDLGVESLIAWTMVEAGMSSYEIKVQTRARQVAFDFSAGGKPGHLAVTVNHEGPATMISPVPLDESSRRKSSHAFLMRAEFDPCDLDSLQVTALKYSTRIPDTDGFRKALLSVTKDKAEGNVG
ncbi:MAG: hypothetical protein PW790_04730 [Parvibaculaceae bacterium]|nr:hypothetical protein [Parvibaculaceae bacterium]